MHCINFQKFNKGWFPSKNYQIISKNYQIISKNYEIIQRGHMTCIEPRKNISQVRTQDFSQGGHDIVIWRFWFLISTIPFSWITEKFKNFQMQEKF